MMCIQGGCDKFKPCICCLSGFAVPNNTHIAAKVGKIAEDVSLPCCFNTVAGLK